MKNILACCDCTTVIIDENSDVLATGDNRFGQIDDTKIEYPKFKKIYKAKYVSACSTNIATIDYNDTMTIRGRINLTQPDIKDISCSNSNLACINKNSELQIYDFKEKKFLDTSIKAKKVTVDKEIFYIDIDDHLHQYDEPIAKNIKVKYIHARYNNFAYIDMDDNLFINDENTNIKAQKVQFGFDFVIILDIEGFVYIKGTNSYKKFKMLPKFIKDYTKTNIKAVDISTGTYHWCYINEDGYLICAGYNFNNQLGISNSDVHFTEIKGLSEILETMNSNIDTIKAPEMPDEKNISSISEFISKENKQLLSVLDKTSEFDSLNTKIDNINTRLDNIEQNLSNEYVQIVHGLGFVIMISEDHNVYVKGKNGYGQLGLGHLNDVKKFTKIDIKAKHVAAGYGHILLIDMRNNVFVSGMNYYGQLGLGHYNHISTFTKIGIKARSVSAGNWSSALISYTDGIPFESGLIMEEKISEFRVCDLI